MQEDASIGNQRQEPNHHPCILPTLPIHHKLIKESGKKKIALPQGISDWQDSKLHISHGSSPAAGYRSAGKANEKAAIKSHYKTTCERMMLYPF